MTLKRVKDVYRECIYTKIGIFCTSIRRKYLKKLSVSMLVLFTVCSALGLSNVNVNAVNHNVQETFDGSWTAIAGSYGFYGNATYLTVDDRVAFCLMPHIAAKTGTNSEVSFESLGITAEQEKILGLIANFGYFNLPTNVNYILTQNLIWEYLGYDCGYVSSVHGYPTLPSQNAWQADVMTKINVYQTGVSFHNGNYEVNVGQTITLTDANNVLSTMQVVSSDGLQVSINGNQLSITGTVNASDISEINLIKPISNQGINFVVRNGSSQAVSILNTKDPKNSWVTVKVNKYGSLELAKQDNKGNFIPNTTFKLSYNADMSQSIGTYTTGANGKIKIDELLPKKIYIQEVSVPGHLVLDPTIYSKDIVSNVTTSYSASNTWKQGYIQVVKKDKDTGKVVQKVGTTFNVYKSDNTLVATLTTNASGYAKTGLLDYGDYYVQETKAPDGFVVDSTKHDVNVRDNLVTVETIVSNKEVRGTINLVKEDSETGGTPQGNTSLLGAKYKLYAKSDILDPADGSIKYASGAMISEKEIDVNRKIVWDNLYLGDYYIQESFVPKGYNIDSTRHNITLNYVDQNTEIVTNSVTSKEEVIRGDIYLVKYLENSIHPEEALRNPGKNIVFKITSKTTGQNFYIKTNENGHASTKSFYYTDEACTKKVTSNNRGALPFDTYSVKEVVSTTPGGFASASEWTVIVSNQGEMLYYIVRNGDINSAVKILKADKSTGRSIPVKNTEFELYDADMKLITMKTYYPNVVEHKSFKTDGVGTFQFPDMLAYGTYYLKEINAPKGYLKGELLKFKITESNIGDFEQPLVVTYYDDNAMGKANITKLDSIDDKGIENTEIGIYAREDIVTTDGTIRFVKDELVDSVMTDKEGKATTKELFLGKYYAKEIKQAKGYALSNKEYNFELKYKDQNTAIVEEEVKLKNNPTSLKLIKTLLDSDKKLSGVQFKIWNADTHEIIRNANGDLKNNFLLGVSPKIINLFHNLEPIFITDENGEINYNYLNPGTYKIQEVKTLEGLVLDGTVYEFTVGENGLIDGKDMYTRNITNAPTKVEFDKTNEDGSVRLADAHFDFIDKETGEVIIRDYVTTKESKIYEGIFVTGRTYIVSETKAPLGYAVAPSLEFTIANTAEIQKIVIHDELILTDIQVNKVDAQTKKTIIANEFEFTMYEDEACTIEIETAHADTRKGVATFKDVNYGVVYIKETKAPEGYQLSDEVKKITINNDLEGVGDVHSFEYLNTPIRTIRTGDYNDKELYMGTLLFAGIIATRRYIIYNKKRSKKDGNV